MKLTKKDAALLANLYETEMYRAFKRVFMEDRQMELAQQAAFMPNMEEVCKIRGAIIELRLVEAAMQQNHKKETH